MTADARAQGAVSSGRGRCGGGVVVVVSSAATRRFRAVLVSTVSAQQLARAEVTRHRYRHRRGAALQPVTMAVTGGAAQEGLRPLPVTACGHHDKSVNRKSETNFFSGGQ